MEGWRLLLTCDDGDLAFEAEEVEDVSVPGFGEEHYGCLFGVYELCLVRTSLLIATYDVVSVVCYIQSMVGDR